MVPPTAIARIYVGLADDERALDWLERAYEVRDGDMYLLKAWPVCPVNSIFSEDELPDKWKDFAQQNAELLH